MKPFVELFTDGSASVKTHTGGWAAILRCTDTNQEAEFSGSMFPAKVGHMELQAVVNGLMQLTTPCKVMVTSDSEYVTKGATEWMPNWKRLGWRRRKGDKLKPIKNEALWKQLDELLKIHDVQFTHVRGHTGHVENERCDVLASAARLRGFGSGEPTQEGVTDTVIALGEIPSTLDGTY